MDGEEAIAWVDRYRRLVNRKIVEFMVNTPYDLEDFLHDAYEAALKAGGVSSRKGISFSAAFWRLFTRNAFRVSPCIHGKRRKNVSMSVFDGQSYADEAFYGGDIYLASPEEILVTRGNIRETEEEILCRLRDRLSPVEKKVLGCVCGLDGGRMSLNETASFLGMTEGAVHQACRRITKRAEQFREDCLSAGYVLERGRRLVMEHGIPLHGSGAASETEV